MGYNAYVAELDRLKLLTEEGREYWYGRDLQRVLKYERWEDFADVIGRALVTSESAGAKTDNHFRRFPKLVSIGSGAQRQVEDWYLSRYACYLIAMNADGNKREVAHAQTYFAIQTRRQEQTDQRSEEERRYSLRARVRQANKGLNSAAKMAQVERFAIFHDAGIRSMYGGKGKAEILARKGIGRGEDWLNRFGSTELAAHFFRITQTEERLKRNGVRGEALAIETHQHVGRETRAAMVKTSGIVPEDLPAAPPLKRVPKPKRGPQALLDEGELGEEE